MMRNSSMKHEISRALKSIANESNVERVIPINLIKPLPDNVAVGCLGLVSEQRLRLHVVL
jgi:hypothetical protein